MDIHGISHSRLIRGESSEFRWKFGSDRWRRFFGGILIGYALKKIIKIVAIITGFFLAALAYLQYQQIANIKWDGLQTISEDTLTTLANTTQQIPGFDSTDNVPPELASETGWEMN